MITNHNTKYLDNYASLSSLPMSTSVSRPFPRPRTACTKPVVASKPATRPKPNGSNVRAFIEQVEKGSKPQPDFFRSKDIENSAKSTNIKPKPSAYKLKLKQNSTSGKASNRVKSSGTFDKTPVHQQPLDNNALKDLSTDFTNDQKTDAFSEHGSIDDSGISSCDLKYSDSISSNHSSNETHYQASSASSCEAHYHSTVEDKEQPYSEAVITAPPVVCKPTRLYNKPKTPSYAVSMKVNTLSLPRSKKRAAVIGKAVAKGRSSVLRKPFDATKSGDSTIEEGESSQTSTLTDTDPTGDTTVDANDGNDSDSNYKDYEEIEDDDSDFKKSERLDHKLSDSSWETDGESSPLHDGEPAAVGAAGAAGTADDDTPEYREFVSNHQSQLETDETEKLVTLMRDKGRNKSQMIKRRVAVRRLKDIKQSLTNRKKEKLTVIPLDKFKKSKSSGGFSAMKSYLGKKIRQATTRHALSKADDTDTSVGLSSHFYDRDKSTEETTSINMASRTSSNSVGVLNDSTDTRSRTSSASSNHRTESRSASADVRSKASLDIPPPPPPRKSLIWVDSSLDDSTPPPPPPRSTSMVSGAPPPLPNTPIPTSPPQDLTKKPYSPKFTKTTRVPALIPSSSPKLSNSRGSAASLPALQMYRGTESSNARHTIGGIENENCRIPTVHSTPSLSDAEIPRIPVRRESSKSLLIASSLDDESKVRKQEILSKAVKTVVRKTSGKLPLAVDSIDEEDSPPEDLTSQPDYADIDSLEDEPLYQEYHASVINTLKRNKEDNNQTPSQTNQTPSQTKNNSKLNYSSTLLRTNPIQMELWSSSPQVRSSCVLEHMSQEEVKLQESMYEVVTTEASYLRSLNMLIRVFVNSEAFCNPEILPLQDKKALFSNITAVQDVSNRLFEELDLHWKDSVILTDICEIVRRYSVKDFDVYIKYCSGQAYQDRTLKKLMENRVFLEALNLLEKSPECHGLNMSSFLLLPMQRITRLPLLLDAILRRQDVWSDQGHIAKACYEQVKKVVQKCNEGAKLMEQTEQVFNVQKMLQWTKCKSTPLMSAGRQLVKSGELLHLAADGARSASSLLAIRPKSLHLFLFNDLLLITKKKGEHYSVIDYGARVNVETEAWSTDMLRDPRLSQMAGKSSAKFILMLALLENHLKKHTEYVLCCHTETERTRWIDAFSSQVENDDNDKIYESWDCPQVQVAHDYHANQPDELDLNAGEVLNILRKTADGWYEGEKVSDGRTGWIPSNYTLVLTNDHTRARHLKERYKLLQLAAKQLKK